MADDGSSHDRGTDVASHDGRQCIDNGPDSSSPRRHRTTARQDGGEQPLPWLALDYDYFETDDRHPSLDSNAPALDEELVAQTGFDPSDADESAYWQWLKELNDGRGDSSRWEDIDEVGLQRDLDVICDRLGATDYQRTRAERLLDRIDIKAELIPDGPIELAVLGVISVVVDEDRTRYARGTYNADSAATDSHVSVPQSVLRDNAFGDLCSDFDISRSRVRDVRHRLRGTDEYESPSERGR